MTTIVTRAGKGSPLTNAEVDANFTNLNSGKFEKSGDMASYVDIDTTATPTGAVGRLKWSTTEAGPEIGMGGGNVTLQIGQEELVYVLNKTGSAFTDMQVVRVVGAQGNRLEVALALGDSEANSAASLAVVTEPIANNAQGFATRGGLVNGVDTSAFAEGALLFLSPTVPGGITATAPTPPSHAVRLGWCVRSHASVGSIFVHIQNGYELDELHDVLITSKADAQVLQYEASTTLWKNKTLLTTNVTEGTNLYYTDARARAAVSGSAPLSYNSTTGAFTITQATTSTNGYLSSTDWNTFDGKQSALVSGTSIKTVNSTSLLGSGDVAVQATLVSGTSIKTINGNSLLGSGNLTVSASPGGSTTQVQYNSGGAFAGSANLTFNGTNLTCGGTVTANSDETLKTNWRDLPADFIEQLAKVKSGTYDRLDLELTQDGVSAQSLQPLLPSSVLLGEDGKLSVAYGNAALVAAIELAKMNIALEARLNALEAKLAKLLD